MEIKNYGDRGVLLAGLKDAERSAWLAELNRGLPDGCDEYVVGFDSILLIGHRIITEAFVGPEDAVGATSLRKFIGARQARSGVSPNESLDSANPQRKLDVEVCYDGADLASVAKSSGLTVRQVIELHCAPTYTVRIMGFSPGFPYLEGLDPRLHLDRRSSPRNRIEPGTVAIGGPHAGIYSVASPGGWHLLGHTDFSLFDREAASQPDPDPKQVFALSPGDQLCFLAKEGA